jgi:hypothetical protein
LDFTNAGSVGALVEDDDVVEDVVEDVVDDVVDDVVEEVVEEVVVVELVEEVVEEELLEVVVVTEGTRTKYAAIPAMTRMTTTIATVTEVLIAFLERADLIFILGLCNLYLLLKHC